MLTRHVWCFPCIMDLSASHLFLRRPQETQIAECGKRQEGEKLHQNVYNEQAGSMGNRNPVPAQNLTSEVLHGTQALWSNNALRDTIEMFWDLRWEVFSVHQNCLSQLWRNSKVGIFKDWPSHWRNEKTERTGTLMYQRRKICRKQSLLLGLEEQKEDGVFKT